MKNVKSSLTIIVTAYKEAENIGPTVENILAALDNLFSDYEILIIDCLDKNGQDDGTREIAEKLAAENPRVKSIQNPYVSLGYKFWQGVSLAGYEYVTWIPGDNETMPETIKEIFRATGRADVVCAYTANPQARSYKRRIVSKTYTLIVNLLFGLHLNYFNGVAVYKTALLKSLPKSVRENEGYTYNTEILVRLIKSGASFVEVPQYIRPQGFKKAESLNPRSFILRYTPLDVIKRIGKLFWAIEIRKEFSKINK